MLVSVDDQLIISCGFPIVVEKFSRQGDLPWLLKKPLRAYIIIDNYILVLI